MRPWKLSLLSLTVFTLSLSGWLAVNGRLTASEPSAKETTTKEEAKKNEPKSEPGTVKQKSARPANLLPLQRFYDHDLNEHIYSLKKDEREEWRKKKHFSEHGILGDASPVELPGTARLWRAIRNDGKHYFYFKSSGQGPNVKVEHAEFQVWVWTEEGDGRIPIFGHTWTDETDVFLEPDLKNVKKFRADSQDALGVSRLSLAEAGDETPIFYVYPHVAAKKPEVPKVKSK